MRLAEVDGNHPVVMEVGPDRDEAADQLGPSDGDEEPDDAPVAPADEVSRPSDDVFEHADRVGGHVVVVERSTDVGRVAVAAPVEGDDSIAVEERRGERLHDGVAVGEPAVEQQHRLGATVAAVVHPCRVPVDRHALTHHVPRSAARRRR